MTKNRNAKNAFLTRVDRAVARTHSQGATSFEKLLEGLPGIYPSVALEALARLHINVTRTSRPVVIPKSTSSLFATGFTLPHPLDFDWRFTAQTAEFISHTILSAPNQSRDILCLGCPTVASHIDSLKTDRKVKLLDINAASHGVGERWDAYSRDSSNQTRFGAAIVVVDPPWYPKYFREFLWYILTTCDPGTDVLIASPPWGTRPSSANDTSRLHSWYSQCGFELISSRPLAIRYTTPLFEINTLVASGIHDVPLDWRRADLLHLRLVTKSKGPKQPRPLKQRGHWEERRFGPVRVRIRTDLSGAGDVQSLAPLGNLGFLPSVSAREPLRTKANVVTSGGRFYYHSNPQLFLELCDRLIMEPQDPTTRVSGGIFPALDTLIRAESAESKTYYETVCAFV